MRIKLNIGSAGSGPLNKLPTNSYKQVETNWPRINWALVNNPLVLNITISVGLHMLIQHGIIGRGESIYTYRSFVQALDDYNSHIVWMSHCYIRNRYSGYSRSWEENSALNGVTLQKKMFIILVLNTKSGASKVQFRQYICKHCCCWWWISKVPFPLNNETSTERWIICIIS